MSPIGRGEREPGVPSGAEVLTAPAKLTLSLEITGVRPDGYHLLESEMVTVDLADTLVVSDGDRLSITMDRSGGGTGPGSAVPGGADNLVAQALDAVGRRASVELVKRIPPGGGLGGGSADAAAVLRWAGCTDVGVAAHLGADVPFCLSGGRAIVRGIGEQIEPLPFEDRAFVLCLVPFGVDTASVYARWDARRTGSVGRSRDAPPAAPDRACNDLTLAALDVEPRLATWRKRLETLTGAPAMLAGSGSTWFVEGTPDSLGIGDDRTLAVGDDAAVLVPVRTVPGVGAVPDSAGPGNSGR
ncbi:MAG: 4-(cytidine 5'-diphospho)-2-C-methyl-D-erythritol kinase [Acidimicrobiales bacterium]